MVLALVAWCPEPLVRSTSTAADVVCDPPERTVLGPAHHRPPIAESSFERLAVVRASLYGGAVDADKVGPRFSPGRRSKSMRLSGCSLSSGATAIVR
jgi:hypothetical protein